MSKNIMVVDDDPDIRDTLAVMLSLEGFVVRTASNRDDALSMLWLTPPDCILLDIRMTGMKLETFIAKVCEVTPRPCIILMTAYFKVDEKARQLKLHNSLQKPFTYKDVMEALARCFDEENGKDHHGNQMA